MMGNPLTPKMSMEQLKQLKNEHQMLSEKLMEMEMEGEEHRVVIEALEPLDGSRRCHRLVGGVLVERSVAEVLPALQRNKEGIKEALDSLRKAIQGKEEEIVRLQKESVAA